MSHNRMSFTIKIRKDSVTFLNDTFHFIKWWDDLFSYLSTCTREKEVAFPKYIISMIKRWDELEYPSLGLTVHFVYFNKHVDVVLIRFCKNENALRFWSPA